MLVSCADCAWPVLVESTLRFLIGNQQAATGKRGATKGRRTRLWGRSRGRLTTKIHLLADAHDANLNIVGASATVLERDQHLLDPRQERRPVHGTIEHHRRRHAAKPEAADECRRLPMTVRDRTQAAGAAPRSPAQPGHLGRRAGLIDEDKALRIKLYLCGAPGLSLRGDVRALLLAGVRGFF